MTKKLNSAKKGAMNELKAAAWLVEQGYDVYRAVSPDAPFDLVAFDGEELFAVEVKTMSRCIQNGKTYENTKFRVHPHVSQLLIVDGHEIIMGDL